MLGSKDEVTDGEHYISKKSGHWWNGEGICCGMEVGDELQILLDGYGEGSS